MTDGVGLPACPASLTRLAGRGGGEPFGCRDAAGVVSGGAAGAAVGVTAGAAVGIADGAAVGVTAVTAFGDAADAAARGIVFRGVARPRLGRSRAGA